VNDDSREQEQTDYPEQRTEIAQVLRVTKRIKMMPVTATIIFFPTDER
jgi:hypothetical protein